MGSKGKKFLIATPMAVLNELAEQFVDAHKLQYCMHWNGHFCAICATDDLAHLLGKVFVQGRVSMSQEIYKHVLPPAREAGPARGKRSTK